MKQVRLYNDELLNRLTHQLQLINDNNLSKMSLSNFIEEILEDYLSTSRHTYDTRLMGIESQLNTVNDKLDGIISYLSEQQNLFNDMLNSMQLDLSLEDFEDD